MSNSATSATSMKPAAPVETTPGPLVAPDPAMPPIRRKKRLRTAQIVHRALLGLVLLIQVYPFIWLLLTSIRTPEEFAAGNPFGLPASFTLDNFSRAIDQGNIPTYILNSASVTVGACALIAICGMMGAYAIQVLGFKGARIVRAIFLMGIVVPVQIALVPLFIDYSTIGLLDTQLSIIIPLAGFALPMSLFLFMSFFSYIPREIYEAASIDGAGPYRIFARITLPIHLERVRLCQHLCADRGPQDDSSGTAELHRQYGKDRLDGHVRGGFSHGHPSASGIPGPEQGHDLWSGERLHEGVRQRAHE